MYSRVMCFIVQQNGEEHLVWFIPDICHGLTDGVRGEKICHVEKFQIPVHDRCGEV